MDRLTRGARTAVDTCMAVRPGERVVLITDERERDVGDALEAAVGRVTDQVQRFVLEDLADRPLRSLPAPLADAAGIADVSFWAAASLDGELPARMEYRRHLRKARHAHMPGITRELMETGMNADYDRVADLTLTLHDRLQDARRAVVKSDHGTNLEVVFHPRWQWLPDTGRFHEPGDWGNLPAGEVYTAPAWLHGRIVTPLLGDHFSERYGVLEEPLVLDVVDNHVDLDSVEGATKEVREDLCAYLTRDPRGTRAGEFALGTNVGLTGLVGNLLQDEKVPGVHVAFGHPYSEQTGAPWTASTHVDVIMLDTDLWVDGEQVQFKGQYDL